MGTSSLVWPNSIVALGSLRGATEHSCLLPLQKQWRLDAACLPFTWKWDTHMYPQARNRWILELTNLRTVPVLKVPVSSP